MSEDVHDPNRHYELANELSIPERADCWPARVDTLFWICWRGNDAMDTARVSTCWKELE